MEERSEASLAYVWATQRLTSTQDAFWDRFAIAAADSETAGALLSANSEAQKRNHHRDRWTRTGDRGDYEPTTAGAQVWISISNWRPLSDQPSARR
ncbi:MAG TPA: hypothetical protein VKB76_09515 [Ktedonobacterales bacterium]|nr:hypothetical protein [Ktedonobacterales bacterium]